MESICRKAGILREDSYWEQVFQDACISQFVLRKYKDSQFFLKTHPIPLTEKSFEYTIYVKTLKRCRFLRKCFAQIGEWGYEQFSAETDKMDVWQVWC